MAAAIRYALSRRTALCRWVNGGHIEIDNNTAERLPHLPYAPDTALHPRSELFNLRENFSFHC
jgi:hypothetical protein